ncbi:MULTISPECIES: hypothetical protein [Arenibacter]|jgi:hypothetical protein|uniref:Uncharacterized protein n=1 Tax=Arenibacter algicola TaxID=616991 RepID=A0A221UVL6_9FLAO|nr:MULTISPECIES: hypothetical protein [Arenibacter]ASO05394.1 hypothetical protein AREALGSMS7_01932 [Arenibacter algicola]MCK0189114.1 hypothetical protein [Arenibacter sp. F20364]
MIIQKYSNHAVVDLDSHKKKSLLSCNYIDSEKSRPVKNCFPLETAL